MSLKFQKRIENFICAHCGEAVVGTGFTNHCPHCLYSQHVDVYPGDREETCGGLMKPSTVVLRRGRYVITHQCQKCGEERSNEAAPDDEIGKFLISLV